MSWNATDSTFSATSTSGIEDKPTLWINTQSLFNYPQGFYGTGTYLGDGWFVSAEHIVTSPYGTPDYEGELTTTITVNGVSQTYGNDAVSLTPGSPDIGLVHMANWNTGPLATLPGVLGTQIYTGGSESGNLVQLGGYGEWGYLGSGLTNNATFHRAFNVVNGIDSGGNVSVVANPSTRLVNDGYLMGIGESGDSGSPLWMDNGPDTDLNLWDYSLIGALETSTGPAFYDANQYARVSYVSSWLLGTVFGKGQLFWNSAASSTKVIDGGGNWNLSTTNFGNGVGNYAWDNTSNSVLEFGCHEAAAGTVTLGANVSVQNLIFNPALSGNYTIAGSGSYSINVSSGTMITMYTSATISAPILGGGISVLGAGGALTLSGNLGNTGGLAVYSGATAIVSGNNTETGNVIIHDGGTLQLQANAANTTTIAGVATSSAIGNPTNAVGFQFSDGDYGSATLQLRSDSSVTFANTYTGNATGNTTLNIDVNSLSGKTSNQTLTVGGLEGIYGTTINVTGGNHYSLGLGPITNGFNNFLTLNAISANVITGNIGLASPVSSITLGATGGSIAIAGNLNNTGAISVSGTNAVTISGVVTGTTLTQSDTGTVTLASPASSYSSVTTLNAGILNFATIANEGSNSSLGDISAATDTNVNTIGLLLQGGTLQYTGPVPQSSNRQIRLINGASGVVTGTIDASGTGSGTLGFTATTASNLFENVGYRTLNLTGTNAGSNYFGLPLTDQAASTGTTSLLKTGAGKWVLSGASTYTGSTNVAAGTLAVTGSLGNTQLGIQSGAALSGAGNGSTTGLVTGPVTVAGGGSIDFSRDGLTNSITTLSLTGGLTLAAGTGSPASLTFNINAGGTDLIRTGTSALNLNAAGATVNVNETGALASGTHTYTLMTFASDTGGGAFSLGAVPPGLDSFALISNPTSLQLAVTATAAPVTAYWTGNYDNSTWSGYNANTKVTNFSANSLGTIDAGQLVGSYTDVVFNAASASTPVTSVLGANFQINSLTFNSAASVSINGNNPLAFFAAASNGSSGSLGYTAGTGLIVSSAAGPVSIGVSTLYAAANQTWANNSANPLSISSNVAGTASIGGSTTLTLGGSGSGNTILSGGISDGSNSGKLALVLAETGSGQIILSGPVTLAGSVTVNSGTAVLSGSNTLAGGVTINGGTLQLGSGAAFGLALPPALAVNGGTLDLHGNRVTVSSLTGSASGGIITDSSAGPGITTLTLNYNGTNTLNNYEALNDGVNGEKIAFADTGIGAGILAMRSNGNFSGGSLLEAGAVDLYANNALGTGTITLGPSSLNNLLPVNNGLTIGNAIVLNNVNPGSGAGSIETINPSDTVTLAGSITVNANPVSGSDLVGPTTGGSLNIQGPIYMGGTATSVTVGGGIVKFSGGGSYSAMSISTVSASLGANNGLATNAVLSLGTNGAGTLNLSGFNQTLAGLLQVNNAGVVTNSKGTFSTLTINGSIETIYTGNLTGNLNLAVAGSSTFVLNSTGNAYAGATTVSSGTLKITSSSSPAPVASYNFSAVNGSVVPNVGTGTGMNAVLNGAGASVSTTGGPIAGTGALNLNGSGATLDVNSPVTDLGNASNWTVSMWVKTSQAGASLLNKGDGTNWSGGFSSFYLGSTYHGGSGSVPDVARNGVGWTSGTATIPPANTDTVNDGTWHLVTYTDALGTMAIYVDGVSESLSQNSFSGADTGSVLRFGFAADPGDGAVPLNGSLSDINIYNSALSAAQIQNLYTKNYLAGSYAANVLPATTPVTLSGTGTLDIEYVNQTIASLQGSSATAVILGSGSTLTIADATSSEFDGTISGSGNLNLPNARTFTLGGAGTYVGLTTVGAGGTLNVKGSLVSTAGVITSGTINFAPALNTSSSILARTIGPLTINAGGLIAVGISNSHANRSLILTSGLSIAGSTGAWTGKFDLGNGDLDVQNGNLMTITSQLRQGYNGGGWNASEGITSSAATDTTHLTALGVMQNTTDGVHAFYGTFDGIQAAPTDVLVKYTYYGDANLDGKVDGTDYTRIDNGYLTHLTGWFNGDFNYDGVIDGSDYTLIDNSFNTQGAALTSEVARSTAQIAGYAVPEPASLCLIGICAMGLLSRRHRRNRAREWFL